MKTSILKQLTRVAPHLYRHDRTLAYYAIKKINGLKKVHPLDTADPKTAERQLLAWLLEKATNTPGTDAAASADLTVGQLLTKFLEVRAGLSGSTQTAEDNLAAKFRELFDAKGKGMALPVGAARHSHLVLWLNAVAKKFDRKGSADGELRHSSYNRHRLFLMQLFAFGTAETGIKSPFDPELIPAKKLQRVVRLVPTEEEFQRVIADIRHPQWPTPNPHARGGQRVLHQPHSADFAEYLGLAGVGQAEAAALEWPQVDWTLGLVKYTRVKTGKPFSHPIYPWLRPLLERLRAESITQGKSGRVLQIKDVKKALNAAKKRLGLPNFTQRGLRAFLIGRLWKAGVNPKLIAKWQGHSDGGTLIINTYTEVFGSNDAEYERAELAKVKFGKVTPFVEAAAG